jgi:uncharacterized membrane protein
VTTPASLARIDRDDEALDRVEELLGLLLTTGVSLSTAILSAGLGLWFLWGPTILSRRLLHTGLLALMATPMLRVVVSLVEYVRIRDWFFAAMTFGVLLVLAATAFVALRIG